MNVSLNNVLSSEYEVLTMFATDISVSGIYGFTLSVFIVFMRSYEYLIVSSLSIAISKLSGWRKGYFSSIVIGT